MLARNQKLSSGERGGRGGAFFNRGSTLFLTTPQSTNFKNSQHVSKLAKLKNVTKLINGCLR